MKDPRNKRLLNSDVWKLYPPVKPAIPSAMELADAQKRANVALAAKTIRQTIEPIQADELPY